jgi:hypothetical protein
MMFLQPVPQSIAGESRRGNIWRSQGKGESART